MIKNEKKQTEKIKRLKKKHLSFLYLANSQGSNIKLNTPQRLTALMLLKLWFRRSNKYNKLKDSTSHVRQMQLRCELCLKEAPRPAPTLRMRQGGAPAKRDCPLPPERRLSGPRALTSLSLQRNHFLCLAENSVL